MSSTSNTFSAEASDAVSSDHEYEVFLSFRGPDTRVGFTDYLYRRLIDANIRVYKDDEELRKGEEIGPELLQAINKSIIAIPIFSKRYAESKWCLKELVEINNRRTSRGMKVMPIFYNITPSEVRNHGGSFEESFRLHEQKYDSTTTTKWKDALSEIGSLVGWEIPSNIYSREGKLVEDVTKEMSLALKKAYVKITDCLVGLGRHVENILQMLSLTTHGVRVIGIHGMGGIGKSTLAKFVYNHLISNFEGSSFLYDARSKSIDDLRKKMTSDILVRESSNNVDNGTIANRFPNRKVLVVIDDVDESTRIEDLIGKQDKQDWFAPGSRIILTTRNKGFLRQVQVDECYELSEMDHFHSFQLFCRHAFESDYPEEGYAILSEQMVETTGGLPLALEVIGSSLRNNKSKANWEEKLEKLRKVPDRDVSKQLRISYEELDERQKIIFLDIACFFIGEDIGTVIHFWDPNQFYPKEALDILQQKSLIKIEDSLLRMHDQLRDLGREIVREGYIMKPEKQTRLWDPEEATKFFMTKRGKKKIQGICVQFNEESHPYFTEEGLAKLARVKLFMVERKRGFNPQNLYLLSRVAPSAFLSKSSYVLSEVRWLSWPRFPHECIKTSYFSLLNVTILNLSDSTFTNNWDGWEQIKMAKNLKVLDLSWCGNLVKTPDFSSHLQLERLILKECTALREIDESIGMLEHLVHLNLSCCFSLQKLPKELRCMESLTELLISQSGVAKIPHWHNIAKLEVFNASGCLDLKSCISLNNLTSLKKFFLEATRITVIPYSIGDLVHLEKLGLAGCHLLKKLPESIGGLVSLTSLDICYSRIEELPNSIGYLKSLTELRMEYTPIRELPSTIGMAIKLEMIWAWGCRLLCGGLPILPGSLIVLQLPSEIMDADPVPDLSNLINLVRFRIDMETNQEEWAPKRWAPIESPGPWWIGRLSKVEALDLAFPTITTLHPDLSTLSLLTDLRLLGCVHLQSILNLPSNLTSLEIWSCVSLDKLEGLHNLESLTHLSLHSCMIPKIDELPENLISLEIENCQKLKRLPQMSQYKKLETFRLRECDSLVRIHQWPENLISLEIENCQKLKRLPQMSQYKKLETFRLRECDSLVRIHQLPENLISLEIENCQKLKRLPQMSQYKKLETFSLEGCRSLVRIHGRLEALRGLLIKDCMSLKRIPDVLNVKTLASFTIVSCPKFCHQSYIQHEGPILTDKSPESEYERSYMSLLLKICVHSQSTPCLGKRKAEWEERWC